MKDDGLDRDLIKRFKEGDESAFKLLCEKLDNMIRLAAFRIIGNHSLLEDIVIETKAQMWIYKDSLNDDSISNYVFTIARNKAFNQLKYEKRQRNMKRILAGKPEELVFNDALERKELWTSINMAIRKIVSEPCRNAFIMFYLDEKKNKEITKKKTAQKQVVKNMLTKGRKIVREALKDLYNDRT